MRNSILLLLIVFIHILPLQSKDYYFKQMSIENGLSQSSVLSILKDHRGYLWIGTKAGLNRYDGNVLKNYYQEENNIHSLSGNHILDILEDKKGNIWICTDDGLDKYDPLNDSFSRIKYNSSPLKVHSYLSLPDGMLFGGNESLFFYNYEQEKFIKLKPQSEEKVNGRVTGLFKWKDDKIIVTTRWKGMWIYSIKANRLERAPFYLDHDIKSCLVDKHNRIWIAPQARGLFCISEEGQQIAHYTTSNSGLSYNVILDLLENEDEIWIATDGGGINILDTNTREFKHIEQEPGNMDSFPVNSICCLYRDSQNNIWAGTIRGGIVGIKEVSIHTYKDAPLMNNYGLSSQTVISLCQEGNDTIWVGTDGGGINLFNPSTELFKHYPEMYNDKVACIVVYDEARLLLSIYGKGIFLFNKNTGKLQPFTYINEEYNNRIKRTSNTIKLYKIDENRILFLADNIHIYDKRKQQFKIVKLKSREYYSCASLEPVSSLGSRLFVFGENAVFEIDKATNTIQPTVDLEYRHGHINSVAHQRDSLWIGTEKGLFVYDMKNNHLEQIKTSLFRKVNSLICDRNNQLWIGAKAMLFIYNTSSGQFSIQDESDGVVPNEFLHRPVLLTPSDEVYLGGVMGLARVNNLNLPQAKTASEVQLVSIKLNGHEKPLSNNTPLIVEWDYSALTLSVMLPDEDILRKILYRFEVIGNNGFTKESYENQLNLSSMSPGKYEVNVSYSEKNGDWSKAKTVLKFEITPPWWQNKYIIMLLTLAILGSVVLLSYLMIRRKEALMKWKLQEHERESYEEKVRFLINVSHELRTPLTLIYSPLKRILNKSTIHPDLEKQLSGIYKQAKQMRNTINMVLDLRKMEVTKQPPHITLEPINDWVVSIGDDFKHEYSDRDIQLQFDLQDDLEKIPIDVNRCETVLSNLLMNALKFSNSHTVVVLKTEKIDDYVRISLKDQGIGLQGVDISKLFDRFYQGDHSRVGSGIGLSYAKVLLEQLNGKIGAYENEDEDGATFFFDLPLIQDKIVVSAPIVLPKGEEDTSEYSTHKSGHSLILENSVLVVDDEPNLRAYLKEVLSEKFKTVYTASNGFEALAITKSHLPDIIISDIMMPRMNGFELCKQVKETDDLCHIPVILLTTKTDEKSQLNSYQSGADVYLTKPFDMEVLEARMINLLRSKKKLKERYKNLGSDLNLTEKDIKNSDEQFMLKFNQLIHRYMGEADLDVKFIVEEMGVSRATLYNKVKLIMNMGVNDYISKLRIAKACKLLTSTKMPIQEIADLTGYSNQRYFSTAFKQATGFSPSKYRLEKKEDSTSNVL